MTTTFKGSGSRIAWTNGTGAGVSAGDVVILAGWLATIALVDIANGASGTLIAGTGERHTLSAVTAEAWPIGQKLYWNASSSKLTADPVSGYPLVGYAFAAKAAAATTAVVTLAQGDVVDTGGALDWQDSVVDNLDFTSVEPTGQAVGDRYLNSGAGASSATSQTVAADEVLVWNGTDWTRITPSKGMALMTEDDNEILVFTTSWVNLAVLNQAAVVADVDDDMGGTTGGTSQFVITSASIDDNMGGTHGGTEQFAQTAAWVDDDTGGTDAGSVQLLECTLLAGGSAPFNQQFEDNFTVLGKAANAQRVDLANLAAVTKLVTDAIRTDQANLAKGTSSKINEILAALKAADLMASA